MKSVMNRMKMYIFWKEAGFNKQAAYAHWRASSPDCYKERPGRLLDARTRAGDFWPKAIPGRPFKVPQELAAEAAAVFAHGWKPHGDKRRGYDSVLHAARKSPKFREVRAQAGCSDKTLMRAIRREHPRLKRKKVRVRWVLSQKEKKERKRVATLILRLGQGAINATFYIDEASYNFKGWDKYVWVDDDKGEQVVTSPLVTHGRGSKVQLTFAIVVNAVVGPVFFTWLSGTTGVGKKFKVRDGDSPTISGVARACPPASSAVVPRGAPCNQLWQ